MVLEARNIDRSPIPTVIDYFALALTHALIFIALVRLVGNPELDEDVDLPVSTKRGDQMKKDGSTDA